MLGRARKLVSSRAGVVKLKIGEMEQRNWRLRLFQKAKLRLYRTLKSDLKIEEYLFAIPDQKYRRELTKLRSGTHDLRLETGRWSGEIEAERECCICGTGVVEDERHVLLECWPYEKWRIKMFQSIRNLTGDKYRVGLMRDDPDRLIQVLLGDGISDRGFRRVVAMAVSRFLRKVMAFRSKWLRTKV